MLDLNADLLQKQNSCTPYILPNSSSIQTSHCYYSVLSEVIQGRSVTILSLIIVC